MSIAVLELGFKDDELESCTIYAPDIYLNEMHYNMNDKDLAEADPVKIRVLGDIKPSIVSILEKSFTKHFGERISFTEPNEDGNISWTADWSIQDLDFYRPSGTVLIPWTHLFKHGKADLSEKGKKLLDEIYSCLSESNKNQDFQDNVSAINICSYMDLLDKDTSKEITKSRAEAVSNYLKAKSSQNLQKQLPTFKTKAYGITGFLSVKEKEGHNGPFIEIRCILSPKKNLDLEDKKLEKYAEQPVSYLPESTGHNYMSPDQNNYNKDAEAFAVQYTPVYRKDTCSIPNLDLKWKLPDKWHFASDAELKALNNGSASDLLNEQKSLYVMAAFSKDYRSMAHIRLYPDKTIDANDDSAKKEAVQALHNSILVNLDEYAQDIKDELKTEKSEDGDDYISVFNYKDGENEHQRTVHYVIKDGTLALLTEIR